MRLSVTASLVLALGLILPENVSLSGLPEDLEGSGYNLDGSGSGDDPEGEMKDSKEGTNNNPSPAVVSNPANGNSNADKSSSGLNSGSSYRLAGGAAPELVVISNSKSELENKEVTAAATAGGITGAVIGVLLSVILICKWRKKHKEECILNQKKASGEDYLKTNRDVILI